MKLSNLNNIQEFIANNKELNRKKLEHIFDSFNYSVLAGEYIYNESIEVLSIIQNHLITNTTQDSTSEFYEILNLLLEHYYSFCTYYKERLIQIINGSQINENSIYEMQSRFKSLVSNIYLVNDEDEILKSNIDLIDWIFNTPSVNLTSEQKSKLSNFKINNSTLKLSKSYELLFISNILVAYIDEVLSCKKESIELIKEIKFYLETNSNNFIFPFYQIIIDKIGFLEYKIDLRSEIDKSKKYGKKLNYKEHSNTFFKFKNVKDNCFSSFENKLSAYYFQGTFNSTNDLFSKLIYSKQKKDVPDYKNVLEIYINEISNIIHDNSTTNFDKIAYIQAKDNFVHSKVNSQFKNIKPIKKLADYIRINQEDIIKQSEIERIFKDAFSFEEFNESCLKFGALEYIEKIINDLDDQAFDLFKVVGDDYLIKENSLSDWTEKFIVALKKYLKKIYTKTISEYKFNLELFERHQKLPMYLTFTESIVSIDNNGSNTNVYLNSSFIIPNDYTKMLLAIEKKEFEFDARLEDVINKIEIALSSIIAEKTMKDSIAKNDKNNKVFEEKVRSNEWKLVQIAAMFVTIATFVLINVKIFEGKTMGQSASIMFGLAACFTLFNFFFKVLNNSEWGMGDWILLGLISGFIIISLVFYFCSSNTVQEDINMLKHTRLSDSILLDEKLENINHKLILIDSLMKNDTMN